MIGPKAEKSIGPDDGGVLLGDAIALTTGGLVAGATLDGNELGSSLGNELAEAPTEAGADGEMAAAT